MTSGNHLKQPLAELRRRAEERVSKRAGTAASPGSTDMHRMIHELEVRQVELELQNEELRQARTELEARYDDLYEFAPVGYFTLGRYGDIEKTNLTGAALLGWPRTELLGRRFANFVSNDSLPCFNDFLRRVARGCAKESCVATLTKDGDIPLTAYIEATATGSDSSFDAVVVDITSIEQARPNGIAQDAGGRRQRGEDESRKTGEALRGTRDLLWRLSAQHMDVRESERRRIAAELHDGLGQALSLVKLNIDEMAGSVDAAAPDAKLGNDLKRLSSRVKSALDEMRRIALNLRPSTLDQLGIVATLSWYMREFRASCQGIQVESDVRAAEADVPEPLKIAIFRIVQEATRNALKHSEADRIKVSLANESGVTNLVIEDNGKGFDPAEAPAHDFDHGIGLQGMKERAELSGGSYELQSAPDQGTRISVSWLRAKDPE